MWSAKLNDKRQKSGNTLISILYKNGEYEFVEERHFNEAPSTDALGLIVNARIKQLDSLDTFYASLTVGNPIEEVKPVEDTPAKKTKKEKYYAKLAELGQQKTLVDLGVLTPEEAGIPALQAKVKELYLALNA